MKWSFRIARVFGIPIQVHASFLLLPLFILLTRPSEHVVSGLVLIPLVFLFVVLHELGHAVVAMRFGLRIQDITLLPIGGVARMQDVPRRPWHEVVIAAVGPVVNFLIAAGIFATSFALGRPWTGFIVDLDLVADLFRINVMLGTFNLLPAFPMDGGRVLRGLLATVLGFRVATRIAVTVGQVFGIMGILAGLLWPGGMMLAVIGLFVFFGAGQEARAGALRGALEGASVSEAMIQEFHVLAPDTTLGEAAERVRRGIQEDFPVVDEGRLVGLLSKGDLAAVLKSHPGETPLSRVLPESFVAVPPGASLYDLYREMAQTGATAAAVVDGERLTGLVTLERIARFLSQKPGGAA